MEKKGEKVKITEERVQTIKENVAEDPEVLQEMTGGFSVPVIEIIKDVIKKDLRGQQTRHRVKRRVRS